MTSGEVHADVVWVESTPQRTWWEKTMFGITDEDESAETVASSDPTG